MQKKQETAGFALALTPSPYLTSDLSAGLSWPFFVALPPAEMLESSNLVTFDGLANSSSYDTFLLDEERGRLLVGAEDHLFSFDLVNINRDQKQVGWRGGWRR